MVNKRRLIIIQLIILCLQIYALYDFCEKNSTRYNYHSFINSIIEEVNKNNLYSRYVDKFEEVFYHYWDNGGLGKGLILLFVIIVHFIIGLFSLFGLLINNYSINHNKTKCFSFCLYIYTFLVGIIEIYFVFTEEIGKVDLSDEEIDKFGNFKSEIMKNLNEVNNRIFYLRIYSVILLICSFIHIILSFIICYSTKNINKNEISPLIPENSQVYPGKVELPYIYSYDQGNDYNKNVPTVENMINTNKNNNIS